METHFPKLHRPGREQAGERVMTDLRSLVRDTEDLLRATAGDVTDKAKQARSRLSAAIGKAGNTCTDFQHRSVESAKSAARAADDTIRSHPAESIAIALGVGFLLGVMLRRK